MPSDSRTRVLDSFADKIYPRRSPSPRRRSRSQPRGKRLDKKPNRRSRSPMAKRSRSRSRGKNMRSPSPQRKNRSRSTRRNKRSPSPRNSNRRGSARSPQNKSRRDSRHSRSRSSSHTKRDRSPPKRDRSPPKHDRPIAKRDRSPVKRDRSPAKRERSPAKHDRSPAKRDRSPAKRDRHQRSRSRSFERRKDTRKRNSLTPSPTTLDEVLLKETALSASRSKPKKSISKRYEKYDINVIGIHNKNKAKRTEDDIDDDGSAEDFSPTDVIELVHELNPQSKSSSRSKKGKLLFDRDEIINFKEEEEVETKVIRVLPSAKDLHKIEAKLSKSDRRRSKEDKSHREDKRERSRSRERKSSVSRERKWSRERKSSHERDRKSSPNNDSRFTIRREPEKRRYTVTDDDLLSDLVAAAAGGDADRMGSRDKRVPISERLGASTEDRPRRIDDRLGRDPRDRDRPRGDIREVNRYHSTDLRHNLTKRDMPNRRDPEPLVRDYDHLSMTQRTVVKDRSKTPDFSKRPGKGQIDMMAMDPTFVPRSGRYMEHDNRDSWGPPRGGSRGGFRGRGGWRGRREDRFMDKREGRVYESRITDHRHPNNGRSKGRSGGKSGSVDTWKHDKYDELEDELERKAEPSSTTS